MAATTTEKLTDAARAFLLADPGIDRRRAFQLALDADPDLARLHHAGLDGEPAAAPAGKPALVDPGVLLLEAIAARVADGLSEPQARAEAFAASPALVAAWNRGEAVPRPAASPAPHPGPTLVCFRAALDGDLSETGLVRVPIFKVGTWNARRYTAADLDAIVKAAEAEHYQVPLKIGHDDSPGAPAVGRLSKVYRDGDTLLADIADIDPAVLEGIRTGRWLSVSAEIYLDHKRAGVTYKAALRSLALLGAHPPGVDLPPLREALV